MKLNGYAKISVILLTIILIFEIIAILLNENNLFEVLQLIFLLIITFNAGIIVGHRLIK